MNLLLRFGLLLLIFPATIFVSCDSGAGSRSLSFTGNPSPDKQDKILLVYSRRYDESAYNESSIYYLYYDAVVVNRQTGKVEDSATIDLNKTELKFAGKTDNYVLFSGLEGFHALSTKAKLKFITPKQFIAKVKAANPGMSIYSMVRNSDDQLEITTKTGEQYCLSMNDLKARSKSEIVYKDPRYLLQDNIPGVIEPEMFTLSGTYVNDSTIIQLKRSEKNKYRFEIVQSYQNPRYSFLEQSDFREKKISGRTFLNAWDLGATEKYIFILYQTELGSPQYLTCYDYVNDKERWKKKITSFYRHGEDLNYGLNWMPGRKSFIIASFDGYPLSFVDAETGKILWRH